jgi:hypothetical protein
VTAHSLTLISSNCRSRHSSNLGFVFLLVDASLDFVDHGVECGKREAFRLPDTRFPSIWDPLFNQYGLYVVDTSSKYSEKA